MKSKIFIYTGLLLLLVGLFFVIAALNGSHNAISYMDAEIPAGATDIDKISMVVDSLDNAVLYLGISLLANILGIFSLLGGYLSKRK